MASNDWYYAHAGQQVGPVALETLRHLLTIGQVHAEDLVWAEGMPNWLAAGDVAALADVARPTPQAPAQQIPGVPPSYPRGGAVVPNYYNAQFGAQPYANYAGFWIRLAAWLIDLLITFVLGAFAGAFIGGCIGGFMGAQGRTSPREIQEAVVPVAQLAGIVVGWLYFAISESSAKQATFGKRAVGIYVTDLQGRRISFGRATGRHFASLISALLLCIGYIMVAFTDRKQGLHDIMAGTLVYKR